MTYFLKVLEYVPSDITLRVTSTLVKDELSYTIHKLCTKIDIIFYPYSSSKISVGIFKISKLQKLMPQKLQHLSPHLQKLVPQKLVPQYFRVG